MKVTYRIHFGATARFEGRTGLDWIEVVKRSGFSNMLARLYHAKDNSFPSVDDAIEELLEMGNPLILECEDFVGVPFQFPNHSLMTYYPSVLLTEGVVDCTVRFDEYPNPAAGRTIGMYSDDHCMYFMKNHYVTQRPFCYIPELTDDSLLPGFTGEEMSSLVATNTRELVKDFLTKLGTANYTRLLNGKPAPTWEEFTGLPNGDKYVTAEPPVQKVELKMSVDETAEDTKDDIPNHLLHGHDADPVIHPPRMPATSLKDEMANGTADRPEPAKTQEASMPKENNTYPVKHEQVYRTAALALSKLDLTAVIKAQRIIFPDSEYWKEITRAKLYEVLMDKLMKECDWEVGMIDQGNGPFLDHNPHPLGDDHEKFPFLIHSFVSQDPSSHKQTYKFAISYLPLSTVEELEIKK